MSESKRMTSIARRMNRSWLARLFWTLLWVDLVILSLLALGWCAWTETSALGDKWTIRMPRTVAVDTALPWYDQPGSAVYSFTPEGGEVVSVACGGYLNFIRIPLLALVGFEMLFLFGQYGAGRRKARRLLEPLTQMTLSAQALARKRLDPEKLHHLEDAILNADPLSKQGLSTGDQDLKGLEEAINSMVGRMQETYRQQSRFVSDASHELRTPIAVIGGYADMLDRWGKTDEKVLNESIAAIRSESAHMQKLVEQLLFLARGDSDRNKLACASFDLSAMMREVYEEYRMIDDKHQWRFQAEEKVMAFGDLAMLKQTARILTDNAVKYTPEGEMITLRARFLRGVPCFEVQDNGEGIPAADLPHVFERFFRADPARTRKSGGTGLGLSIAKWIVDKHEGYFDMISREGIGTRIAVCLPKTQETPKAGGAGETAKG